MTKEMESDMAQPMHLSPSPFLLQGGPVGVLLIHGFTGAPPEMRLVGDYLHERGLTVSGPCLPGHGTVVEDANRCSWRDWTTSMERELANLQSRCKTVFVGGLSLGSLLSLYLAAHHPELSGTMVYSPAVLISNRLMYLTPVLRHFIVKQPKSAKSDLTDPQAGQRLWCYDENPVGGAHEVLRLNRLVRRLLPQVRCPLLVIYSKLDRTIRPQSARYTYERAGAEDKELVALNNSGHCITVDSEWEVVAERTYKFIQRCDV
jgi:carboxylesterase